MLTYWQVTSLYYYWTIYFSKFCASAQQLTSKPRSISYARKWIVFNVSSLDIILFTVSSFAFLTGHCLVSDSHFLLIIMYARMFPDRASNHVLFCYYLNQSGVSLFVTP